MVFKQDVLDSLGNNGCCSATTSFHWVFRHVHCISCQNHLLLEVKCISRHGILVNLTKNIRVPSSGSCFESIKHKNGNVDFKVPLSPEKITSFQFYLYNEGKFWFRFRKPKRMMMVFFTFPKNYIMFRRLLGKLGRLKVTCDDLRVFLFNHLLMKTDDYCIASGFTCEP